jgi:ABC-type polysaccharide/polyol phosphate transport system ATPase subunit
MSGTDLHPGAIRMRGVTRTFRVFHDRSRTLKEVFVRGKRGDYTDRYALRDVDLEIQPGERVGVVGRNGSGKSTMLKLIAGIMPPQKGDVEVRGTVASMLELGAGFHPDFTGRENVYMNGTIHGLSSQQIDERFDSIVAFAEIPEYIDMPVRTYSSGMQLRLAFAVAAHVTPDILLLDEVLAVGDERFQAKCMDHIQSFADAGGTIVFVSHDASAVMKVCNRAILLDDGDLLEDGDPADVMPAYHRLLLARDGAPRPTGTDAAATPLDGADGWGDGKVIIRRAWLSGPEGEDHRFVSGDQVTLHVALDAPEPVDHPIVVGFRVHLGNSTVVFETDTSAEGATIDGVDGTREVTFTIDRLPLHIGWFEVDVWVDDTDGNAHHHIEPTMGFHSYPARAGLGLVALDGSWNPGSSAPTGARAEVAVHGGSPPP